MWLCFLTFIGSFFPFFSSVHKNGILTVILISSRTFLSHLALFHIYWWIFFRYFWKLSSLREVNGTVYHTVFVLSNLTIWWHAYCFLSFPEWILLCLVVKEDSITIFCLMWLYQLVCMCFLVSGVPVPFSIVGWWGSNYCRVLATLLDSIFVLVRVLTRTYHHIASYLLETDNLLGMEQGELPLRDWLKN